MIEAEHVLLQHNIEREKIGARKVFLITLWYLCIQSHFDNVRTDLMLPKAPVSVLSQK